MCEQAQPIIGPYASRPAACRDYDPRSADVARLVAALVYEHLPVRVEHVGSTSVPGCAGEGIVDLMIAVADGELENVKELLDRLGFQEQIGRDPFPETRPMLAGSFVHDGEAFLIHVHVIPASSPESDEMRFFRTCLRADPELLRAYVARKREIIASGVTDSLEYCRIKGEFIKEVLG
ncbi:MAG: GrpB family protein [Pirellulales bacterium]